jgi:hypothetical protein
MWQTQMSFSSSELTSLVASLAAVAAVALSSVKLILEQRKAKKEMEQIKQGVEHLAQFVQTYAKNQEFQEGIAKQKFTYGVVKDIAKGLWEWAKHEDEQEKMEVWA